MQPFQNEKAQLIMTLRGMGIIDADVLAAIEQVPREIFVSHALQAHAYENASLPIAMDQTISQPYIVAKMTAALQLSGRERVLEIGTGSGYQAAILSFLCRRVYSIERLRPLLVEAENRLREIRVTNVTTRLGDGARGWPLVQRRPFYSRGCPRRRYWRRPWLRRGYQIGWQRGMRATAVWK